MINLDKKYDVAAYVWPAYTGEEPRARIFWPDGIGEWQSVRDAVKKRPDHSWPRKPLWGYVNEADPSVMEMEINAAADHGVNVFIYDWYWYDDRPFLDQCLNDGFLKAKNKSRMKFYLMWANHDAKTRWDKRISGTDYESVVWRGDVTQKQFEKIADLITERYFEDPCYYRIGKSPVFAIYDVANLIKGLGGIENTRKSLDWWRARVEGGVHFQLISQGNKTDNISGFDSGDVMSLEECVEKLGFDSVTHYQMAAITDMTDRDYTDAAADVEREWEKVSQRLSVPYFPHVSMGWDNNPRFVMWQNRVIKNNTPENIKKHLENARIFSRQHNDVPLVTVNSWNEWTETSYLQPDDLYGYGYLEAIKDVFFHNK